MVLGIPHEHAIHNTMNREEEEEGTPSDSDDESSESDDSEPYKEYDAIRTYNRVTRDMEQEEAQWEACRNVNRLRISQHQERLDDDDDNDEDSEEKKYTGPDKAKGGRILGPDGKYIPRNRNGKKVEILGNPIVDPNTPEPISSTSTTTLSDVQKRRKNLNKAKRANHNRRDRAARKNNMMSGF
jgi:hypothetical protein